MDAVIRAATADDCGDVAAIFGYYVTNTVVTFEVAPPTAERCRRTFAAVTERGLPYLVCERAGRVAGYAYAAPWRDKPAYRHTVEDVIYLAPEHTGRGLGGRLLRALQRASALAGAEQMIAVIADSGNPASAALHRACGFTEAGRLRNVGRKHGRLIDTLLMQHELRVEPRKRSG